MNHLLSKHSVLIVALGFTCMGHSMAEEKNVEILKTLNYAQKITPSSMDSYLYSTYYYTGKKAYNMKAFELFSGSFPILCMKVNPSGSSYAVLSSNGKKTKLTVRSLYQTSSENSRFEIKMPVSASALCYTADSRHIVMADGMGNLIFYRSSDVAEEYRISVPATARVDALVASPNDYYIAMQTAGGVTVINQQDRSIRKEISTSGTCWMGFSEDSGMLGILTPGRLDIYDTRTFDVIHTFENLDAATSFCFHPEGKYVTVVEQGRNLNFYNLVDASEKLGISDADGNITQLFYLKDGKSQTYLTSNSPNSLRYRMLANITPNYQRLVKDELEKQMAEYLRKRNNETDEQYNERTSEEKIKKYRQLLVNKFATEQAGDLIGRAGIVLEKYDAKRGVLTLVVKGTTNKIYLFMPESEFSFFSNLDNVEFRNVEYGLTEHDSFEVVYADVYNKATGKTYTFDIRSEQNLEFLITDTELHLLEDIKFAQREEILLKKRTKEIADAAKESKKIEHTEISTNAQIVRSTDASGKSIKNYKIDFEYNVDADYSLKEDFAPGKYKIEESHAASTMLEAITKSFTEDFAKYFVEGKKLEVSVTGAADATPIRGKIAYDESYGQFTEEPYFLNGNLNNLTITHASGITKNEQLAFLRSQGVRSYLEQHMAVLSKMNVRFVNHIELPEGKGSKFRRIKVSFSFVDADIQ